MAKCPKCGKEVQPKKTWKMAGRPDKTGKRTELTIGLCECCGKTFRTTLGKKKIQRSGKIDLLLFSFLLKIGYQFLKDSGYSNVYSDQTWVRCNEKSIM